MKKFYSLILAILMILSLCLTGCGGDPAESKNWTSEGLIYELNEDGQSYCVAGIEEIGYGEDPISVKIPSEYEGLPVTAIKSHAFEFDRTVADLIIPDSVTYFGSDAFFGTRELQTVQIGKGLSEIKNNDNPFEYSDKLRVLTVSEENPVYHSAGNCLIKTATGALIAGTGESVIPDDGSVKTIEGSAFDSYENLKKINLPEGIISIDSFAFSDCALTEIAFPASLEEIGIGAFSGMDIQKITLAKGSDTFTCVDNCLIEKETGRLVLGCKNSVIPTDGSVKAIGEFAFDGCQELTSIVIPDSVKTIEWSAFEDCDKLTSVTLPNGLKTIGDDAFSGCEELMNVNIPESVTYIGTSAFSFTGLYEDNSKWDNGVFYISGCLLDVTEADATEITVKDGTRLIADNAFYDCNDLEKLVIPAGVRCIEAYSVYYCENLTEITYGGTVAEWNSIIVDDEIDGWYHEIRLPSGCVVHCADGDVK